MPASKEDLAIPPYSVRCASFVKCAPTGVKFKHDFSHHEMGLKLIISQSKEYFLSQSYSSAANFRCEQGTFGLIVKVLGSYSEQLITVMKDCDTGIKVLKLTSPQIKLANIHDGILLQKFTKKLVCTCKKQDRKGNFTAKSKGPALHTVCGRTEDVDRKKMHGDPIRRYPKTSAGKCYSAETLLGVATYFLYL